MTKFVVEIYRVERYKLPVVVEAETKKKALEKVQKEWLEEDYLYDKLTAAWDDADTDFTVTGEATPQDEKIFTNIP